MIYLGSDHGGFDLKKKVKEYLKKKKNIEYTDLGPESIDNNDDYPDFALKVAQEVAKTGSMGILICGTGIGMCITANKVKEIRAALCYDKETAKLSREHNNANILCLGARTTNKKKALKIVDTWLNTSFSSEARHHRRVNKMDKL